MAKQILSDAKLYLGGYNVSGDHNAIALTYGADAVDVTTLADTTRRRVGGLKVFQASHAGFWEGGVGLIDEILNAQMGLSSVVSTLSPQTGAEGDRAFFGTMLEASYAPGASVGDVFAFTVQMAAASDLYSATVLHNATRTSTGTGTIMNLGAVSSLQKIAAALHVYGPVTGSSPTLDVIVQSAAAVGFSSPTTRLTFSQKAAIGAQQTAAVAGPITDAYWRVSYTIGGGSPSFPFLVSLAIQ